MILIDVTTPGKTIEVKGKVATTPLIFEIQEYERRKILKYLNSLGIKYKIKRILEKKRVTSPMNKLRVHTQSNVKLKLKV